MQRGEQEDDLEYTGQTNGALISTVGKGEGERERKRETDKHEGRGEHLEQKTTGLHHHRRDCFSVPPA